MDTNPYGNIMKALGASTTPATGNQDNNLSYEQQMQNYNTFSELSKKGVYLPDLIAKINTLEEKMKAIEEAPKQDINRELFEVMEASVKGDPSVKEAKQKVADVKSAIISEMCMKDQRFREAYDGYRTAVNKAYIQSKEEQASERTRSSQVRSDPSRCVPHKEDDEVDEEDVTSAGNESVGEPAE